MSAARRQVGPICAASARRPGVQDGVMAAPSRRLVIGGIEDSVSPSSRQAAGFGGDYLVMPAGRLPPATEGTRTRCD